MQGDAELQGIRCIVSVAKSCKVYPQNPVQQQGDSCVVTTTILFCLLNSFLFFFEPFSFLF